ncbi:MAG: glycoside hydrolase family 9 protein [Candidatus Aminicenantes bacterium]|nr:glycoside hydrolase family 9 protein [Candidatus Aminicenantes bacterium]
MRFKNHKRWVTSIVCILTASVCFARIEMKPEGYFETPGFAFLVYHNDYLVGKRGGLQMFLHGKRVADAGEVVCLTAYGRYLDFNVKEIGRRIVDTERGLSIIQGKIKPMDIVYKVECSTDGDSVFITVKLDKPLDWNRINNFMLKLEIYPREYRYKTYRGGDATGYFAERYIGKTILVPFAKEISIATEDYLKAFTISTEDAVLSLIDGRGRGNINGFIVSASLPPNSPKQQFSMKITPKVNPSWRREPVIQVSQVGYHPAQRKMAVLELDSRTEDLDEVKLIYLDRDGTKKLVKSEKPGNWGALFNYTYYTFDFTDIKTPGQYYLIYGSQQVGPITISNDIYKETWHPTMDIFFPVQMCHVEVRQGEKIWHGACHLDDGLQAPPNTQHFDSYIQKAETETRFKANEHIPGLDWGGWHDAGDNDLPFGSICRTVLWMALAQEEFGTDRDMTSIRRKQRRVDLFQPDGKNDMLQQISFGMENLLSLYRAAGHICPGIIENNILDYIMVGDPVNITDGLIYDPSLKPDEKKEGRSGKFDDRWIFTNRNTGGQYQFAQVAAIVSRVFKGNDNKLAEECLKAAEDVWHYEQTHAPVHFRVTYQPIEDEYHSWEIAATAELFMTTGNVKYKNRLIELVPHIKAMPPSYFWQLSGFTLVRALEKIENIEFREIIVEKLKELKNLMKAEFDKSPYGVYFVFHVWGNNWDVLDLGARTYYFIKHFPEIFDEEYLYSTVNYNFGCHPASNHSYVSGVGVNSATVGYGFNRSEWTYIPGGVVSGASFLRPKFIEYRSGTWDWYETEYVIGGSAAYVFDILAVDYLLSKKEN